MQALCAAFDDGNPLLKHEIAFVLGQLEHPAAVDALCAAVRSEEEHGMVRHEAAEALGAIGSPDAMFSSVPSRPPPASGERLPGSRKRKRPRRERLAL